MWKKGLKIAFDEIFKKIKARLTDEIADMLSSKKSMRIKTGANEQVGKRVDIDPFHDEEDEPIKKKESNKSYIKTLTTRM